MNEAAEQSTTVKNGQQHCWTPPVLVLWFPQLYISPNYVTLSQCDRRATVSADTQQYVACKWKWHSRWLGSVRWDLMCYLFDRHILDKLQNFTMKWCQIATEIRDLNIQRCWGRIYNCPVWFWLDQKNPWCRPCKYKPANSGVQQTTGPRLRWRGGLG